VLSNRVAAGIVFLAAAAVLVLEIVAMRLVGPYVGITLTNSTAVIGVSLGAIAYGAWTGGALADRIDPHKLLPPVFALAAAATALTLPVVRWMGEALRGTDLFGVVVLAVLAVFVPAALLSAITPVVVKLQLADMKHTGRVVGRLSSIGTLGGITATFVTGFVLVAALPTSTILLVLALVLAAVGAALWWKLGGPASPAWQGWRSFVRRPGGAAGVAVLVLAGVGVTAAVPTPCDIETAYQCARIEADANRPGGRLLLPTRPGTPMWTSTTSRTWSSPTPSGSGRSWTSSRRRRSRSGRCTWVAEASRCPATSPRPARAPTTGCWSSTADWSSSTSPGSA
jgi:hypothetical protein